MALAYERRGEMLWILSGRESPIYQDEITKFPLGSTIIQRALFQLKQ
jgi:hypothetical protein